MARMGERRGKYIILVGKPGRDHLGDLDIDDRIILKWIFNIYIYSTRMGTGLIWFRIGTSDGFLWLR